jgi:hypothetical protein
MTSFRLNRFRFFGASIQARVVLALISALLWWALTEIEGVLTGPTPGFPTYATGAVYAALVLVPYLPGLKGTLKLRALALLICGALSYFLAIRIFIWAPGILKEIGRLGFVGILAALIIGIGARFFIPLAIRLDGWLMLVGAGLVGGVVIGIGYGPGFSMANIMNYPHLLPGHIAWQVLVCLALYYGSNRDSEPQCQQA